MELLSEEKNKKIYQDENSVYTMLNMGGYIGYKNRDWYQSHPDVWVLMEATESTEKGSVHIESLVSDRGEYIRFIMDNGSVRRVLQLDNSLVYSDSVVDTRNANNTLRIGNTYYALNGDIYTGNKIPLLEYLGSNHNFDFKGETILQNIPGLDCIVKYLNANQELRNTISSSETKEM